MTTFLSPGTTITAAVGTFSVRQKLSRYKANSGKRLVSIHTEREIEQLGHPATSIIGIDVGITRFANLLDGHNIEPLDTFRKQQAFTRYG